METEEYFKNDAKTIVDMLFDSKFFKNDITRDDLNATENFISELMSLKFKSQEKFKRLFDRIDKNKTK